MEFNGFERWFAKAQFGFEARTKFYQELSALLRSGMSKPDAVSLLQVVASDEGRKQKDAMSIILSHILRDMQDGVIVLGERGRVLHANAQALEMLGLSRAGDAALDGLALADLDAGLEEMLQPGVGEEGRLMRVGAAGRLLRCRPPHPQRHPPCCLQPRPPTL